MRKSRRIDTLREVYMGMYYNICTFDGHMETLGRMLNSKGNELSR